MLRPSVQKCITCFIAALVCGATFLRIARRFFIHWMPPAFAIAIAVCILLAAVICAFTWVRKKKDDYHQSPALGAWQAIIRYGVALDLILFGLQKFFGLQFSMPLALLDLPFSSFSGEELTFAYFARSFGFVIVIGCLQAGGSILLLFNKTKLLGIFVLLPVMLNIVLINIFYHMETGELVHSSILLLALLYLLWPEYKRLVAFFFKTKNSIPAVGFSNAMVKNGLRYSAIFIPVLLVWSYDMPEQHPRIYGKYQVAKLSVNKLQMAPALCTDSVLTMVYFDQNADCVFEYNSQQRRFIGNYHMDEATHKIMVAWRYPAAMHDTVLATISISGTGIKLTGKMGSQLMDMELVRMKQ